MPFKTACQITLSVCFDGRKFNRETPRRFQFSCRDERYCP